MHFKIKKYHLAFFLIPVLTFIILLFTTVKFKDDDVSFLHIVVSSEFSKFLPFLDIWLLGWSHFSSLFDLMASFEASSSIMSFSVVAFPTPDPVEDVSNKQNTP